MEITGSYIRVYDDARKCTIFEHDKVWLDFNGYTELKSITEYKDGSYVIHHINGNRSDNRIENLQILTRAEHASLHSKYRPADYEERISQKLKGIKRSDETRAKMSAAQKANPSFGMLGKHHTEESKLKSSISNKKTWANKSEEEKARLNKLNSESHKGKPAPNKGIPCPQHQKQALSNLWKDRYENGYVSPSKGRIFVTNGVENHQILKNELEKYLSEGYWRGITRRK